MFGHVTIPRRRRTSRRSNEMRFGKSRRRQRAAERSRTEERTADGTAQGRGVDVPRNGKLLQKRDGRRRSFPGVLFERI